MKILWTEDGVAGLPQSAIAREIFSRILPVAFFDDEFKEDEPIGQELPRLFAKHGQHEIVLCHSFVDWRDSFEADNDFDVILLDINLEAYPTPNNDRPFNDKDFDKRAGLCIYQRLIRSGFPEDHIAFFTGEEVTLKGMEKDMTAILMEKPSHSFEKKQSDLERLSLWFEERAKNPYLQLRRGIINGCRTMLHKIGQTPDIEIPTRLAVFANGTIEVNPDHLRDRFTEKLRRLRKFLPLRAPEYGTGHLYYFLIELCQGRDKSKKLPFEEDNWTNSELERRFTKTSRDLMMLLKDLIDCRMLPLAVPASITAFFFITAMRAWFLSDFTKVLPYEIQLLNFFPVMAPDSFTTEINQNLERYLKISYRDLANRVPYCKPEDSYSDLVRTFCLDLINHSPEGRIAFQNQTLNYLLRAYLHGLCPNFTGVESQLQTNWLYDTTPIAQMVGNRENCAHLMARSVYRTAFGLNSYELPPV